MTVSDWQVQVGALVLGAGTPYGLVSATGLRGLPDLRTQATPRDGADGVFTSPDFAGTRTIELTVDVAASSGSSITDRADALTWAVVAARAVTTLSWREPGRDVKSVSGRWRRCTPLIDQSYSLGFTKVAMQFVCDDPFIYGPFAGVVLTMPSGGGVPMPLTMPVVFSGSTGGAQTVTNIGNVAARPLLSIVGPATFPVVTNLTTGETMSVFVNLGPGDELTINSATRTLLVNGRPARELLVPGSSWITLPPGDSRLSFTASTTSTASACGVIYSPTWIS